MSTQAGDETTIGGRIRLARKHARLSQADLAKRIGVSQPAIATWESGVHDPRRLALAKLADALGASLEWLAAGARSPSESDTQAAAAYLRRSVQHVPIISGAAAARFASSPNADPHQVAEDYIPVTSSGPQLFAIFVDDLAIDRLVQKGALAVIDYADRQPADGSICLAIVDGEPVLRIWRFKTMTLEPHSSTSDFLPIPIDNRVAIIGCLRISIRFH